MNDADSNNRWRLTKDIPLSLVAALVLQTLLFTWWLATQSSALNAVIKVVSEGQAKAYTKEDAVREREFQLQVQKNANDKLDELTRRITILEGQGQVRSGIGITARP